MLSLQNKRSQKKEKLFAPKKKSKSSTKEIAKHEAKKQVSIEQKNSLLTNDFIKSSKAIANILNR